MKKIEFITTRTPDMAKQWLTMRIGRGEYSEKEKLVNYIRKGRFLAGVPGIERDLIEGNHLIPDPPHILTDGEWIWVLTIAYWVERHDLDLPNAFVNHVASNNYEIPFCKNVADFGRSWGGNMAYFWPDGFKNEKDTSG